MKSQNLIVLVVLVAVLFLPNVVSAAEEDNVGTGLTLSIGRVNFSHFEEDDIFSGGFSIGPVLTESLNRDLLIGAGFDLLYYGGELAIGSTNVDYTQMLGGGSIVAGKIFGSKGSYKSIYIGPCIYYYNLSFDSKWNSMVDVDLEDKGIAAGITGGVFAQISDSVGATVGFRRLFKYKGSLELFFTIGFNVWAG